MLKVLKVNDSEFIVIRNGRAHYGDLQRTMLTLHLMGIELEEIQHGLKALYAHGDTVAEYGINGTFIFSKKTA